MSNGKIVYPRLNFTFCLTLMDGKMLKSLNGGHKNILLFSDVENDLRLFPITVGEPLDA
jgi:hypothetical protein